MSRRSISAAIRAAKKRVTLYRFGGWCLGVFDPQVQAWREFRAESYSHARRMCVQEKVFQALLLLGFAPNDAHYAMRDYDTGSIRERIRSAIGRIKGI